DKSIHGTFLKRHFSGYTDSVDKQIDLQLADIAGTEIPAKIEGKIKCYPIGTAALIRANDDRYILFALAKTNPANCKAYSDVGLMWQALHKLWQKARGDCNGDPLNLPLVGSGLA